VVSVIQVRFARWGSVWEMGGCGFGERRPKHQRCSLPATARAKLAAWFAGVSDDLDTQGAGCL